MSFDRKAYNLAWSKTKNQGTRNLVSRWKTRKGCARCGFKGHSCTLDLHHKDRLTKHKASSRNSFVAGWSRNRLKEELSKCIVLCANCHRLQTFNENFGQMGE